MAPDETTKSALVTKRQPARKRPGLAEPAGLANELYQERLRPSSPPSPWLPSGSLRR